MICQWSFSFTIIVPGSCLVQPTEVYGPATPMTESIDVFARSMDFQNDGVFR
jgi:hypothetical protein